MADSAQNTSCMSHTQLCESKYFILKFRRRAASSTQNMVRQSHHLLKALVSSALVVLFVLHQPMLFAITAPRIPRKSYTSPPSLRSQSVSRLQICLPELIGVCLFASVQRCPLWVVLEQTHGLCVLQKLSTSSSQSLVISTTHIFLIRRKTMIDTSRHNHQVTLLQRNPDPIVILASYIKVSAPVNDIPDLFILVQVLVEEVLDLLFIARQCRW